MGIDRVRTYVPYTYIVHGERWLLLLLQIVLQLHEVVGADGPHGHVGDRAGRRCHQLGHDQLLMRKEGRLRTAGNRQQAAAVPLVLTALLLLKPFEPLLPSILL